MLTINVNGKARNVDVVDDMPLLWVLRDELGLTGTKFGCGAALCGACTVHVDGVAMRSCQLPIGSLDKGVVVTIEGVGGAVAAAVQTAWRALDVAQCGYCQSGQIMAATALLTENPTPSDADVAAVMDGIVCRCATYGRIRSAIAMVSKALRT